MFDPLNQNGDDEIDFSEKNLFEGLPVDGGKPAFRLRRHYAIFSTTNHKNVLDKNACCIYNIQALKSVPVMRL